VCSCGMSLSAALQVICRIVVWLVMFRVVMFFTISESSHNDNRVTTHAPLSQK
jgi:hypothetical protein